MNDYERIAKVIRYLDEFHNDQPDLATCARQVGLSAAHFHRLFSRWAGITPKDFLQRLTIVHAKERLRRGDSVLDAALAVGLSGPSRLHDLCVTLEAASPGEVKSGGAGWTIKAGHAESPFGFCLVAASPRGICHLSFVESVSRRAAEERIREDWPRARIEWDDASVECLLGCLFQLVESKGPRDAFRAVVRGTAFQVRVWNALLRIPVGTLMSYGGLATVLGARGAARAVGSAVGRNSLAYLIPCHRVIRETGVIGDYRWGRTRKVAMVAWEGS